MRRKESLGAQIFLALPEVLPDVHASKNTSPNRDDFGPGRPRRNAQIVNIVRRQRFSQKLKYQTAW